MDWTRAKTRKGRCPLCGSEEGGALKRGCQWATIYSRGAAKRELRYIICRAVSAGAFKSEFNEKFGRLFHHHIVDPATLKNPGEIAPFNQPASSLTAHVAYDALLDGRLSPFHGNYLERRGVRGLYTTLSHFGDERNARAGQLSRRVNLEGVAGFFQDFAGRWRLEGPGGILLPVIDRGGLITGCQINRDAAIAAYMNYTARGLEVPGDRRGDLKSKYLWLSSTPEVRESREGKRYIYRENGVSAVARLHFPVAPRSPIVLDLLPEPESYLVIEGVLKADIVASLWEGPERVVGTPGAGACHREAAALAAGASRMLVPCDADWQIKSEVASAMGSLLSALAGRLAAIQVPYWDPAAGKGFDDVLLSGGDVRQMTATEWFAVAARIHQTRASAPECFHCGQPINKWGWLASCPSRKESDGREVNDRAMTRLALRRAT